MNASESRIRALQRIAYGADTTDIERARAIDELAALASRAAGHDEVEGAGPSDGRGTATGQDAADAAGAADAADAADAALDPAPPDRAAIRDVPDRRRLVRWAVAAAGIGLIVGGALGWSAGERVPVDPVDSSTQPSAAADLGTPLERTDLLPLFDRLRPVADTTRIVSIDPTIDPASVRLLADRMDGPSAYLARTIGGENVCLVLLLPAGPSPPLSCTIGGRFPADGLSIQYYAEGYGLSVAHLDASGTVALGLMVTF